MEEYICEPIRREKKEKCHRNKDKKCYHDKWRNDDDNNNNNNNNNNNGGVKKNKTDVKAVSLSIGNKKAAIFCRVSSYGQTR